VSLLHQDYKGHSDENRCAMNLDEIKVKDSWLFTLILACNNTTVLLSHSELV